MLKIVLYNVDRAKNTETVCGTAMISGFPMPDNIAPGYVAERDYDVKLHRTTEHSSLWLRGRVTKFPRLRLGLWDLALRALAACLMTRNSDVEIDDSLSIDSAKTPRAAAVD